MEEVDEEGEADEAELAVPVNAGDGELFSLACTLTSGLTVVVVDLVEFILPSFLIPFGLTVVVSVVDAGVVFVDGVVVVVVEIGFVDGVAIVGFVLAVLCVGFVIFVVVVADGEVEVVVVVSFLGGGSTFGLEVMTGDVIGFMLVVSSDISLMNGAGFELFD
ncbi:unnamed protein product [Ambrosiozyma monospora]|uniref:Unnamed protein product n=1 Tax=Ambrosiozyma monospora TaxID=43982 RepID=A0ACB5TCQ5_AMBMO|nr:unnamed protein product [Ambrosiozyma monospora]